MKKTILMILMIGVLSSFDTVREVSPNTVKELYGYKLRVKPPIIGDFHLWVYTNCASFDQAFVAEDETSPKPCFDNDYVIAAKAETYNFSYKIRFRKAEVVNDELKVYFHVQKHGPAMDGAGPVSLITYSKNPAVKKVKFYHDNVLVKTIPIVTVY
jgi:hypothetical protein